jgi:hypothetical protein
MSKGKYLTQTGARRILNLTAQELDQLISTGQITGFVKIVDQRRVFMLEAESVERLRKEWSKNLTLRATSRYLGICQIYTSMLVQHSFLTSTRVSSVVHRNMWQVEKTHLESFLVDVLSRAKRVHAVPIRKFRQFNDLIEGLSLRLATVCWGIHTLIDDILHGVITPTCVGRAKTLDDLYFPRQKVKQYVRMKLAGTATERITLAQGIKEHEFRRSQLYFWATKGLIKTQHGEGERVQCRVVTAKAIVAFTSKYIDAVKLFQETGIPIWLIVRTLKSQNVYPVSGKSVDGSSRYLFRRIDLAKLDLKKILDTSRVRPREKYYQLPHSVDSQGAAKILSVPKKTIAEMVNNGVLTPYSDSSKTPGEYLFNRTSIERFVGQFVNLNNLISAGAAAEILRTRALRRQWIKTGYLKYETSNDGKIEFLIKSDVEKIARFLNSVVNRQQAEKILGVSGHFINALCREWLRPTQNPYPRAFRDTIYLRADFEKLRSEFGFNGKKLLSKLSDPNRNGMCRSRLPVTQ